ncbi:oligoendopeptidase F [Deinococcus sp. KSM4-11]|uniref:oligoendopeptidase F n=1 Tax=Deinococcus sp. KSM4-11 TaxID=2568654 RepID=UPI0010A2D14F|nr:oligoendopeptidase F [Deinococcus sp. KSM4-11]THF88346.1 oligoendopeptidase F [Deinococcus sp. KSM4-11]
MTAAVKALPARADVPQEQTWDIEALYATPADWEAEGDRLPTDIDALDRHRGQLAKTPEALLAYLTDADAVQLRMQRFASYASMTASVDGRDAVAGARRDRANGLLAQLGSVTAFAQPELLAIPEATLAGWLARPDFADQRVRLERMLRNRPHVRSAEIEALLGAVQAPFASERGIHPALANMDLRFGTAGGESVTQGNVDRLTASADREIRREAWEQYADAHLAVRHAQAAMYATNVRQSVFLARARRYPDTITASLAPDAIPTQVVTTLLDTYRSNTPTWHRYWRVRRDWLKLPELREFDVKAALVPSREVSYPQAVEWIAEGMAPLGDDYVREMREGLTTGRWVDYAENDGKRQGAYSNGGGRVKPFIFMTWNGTMNSYSTLAHEIGHSMHSLLSSRAHPYSVPRYTLFHAEVASNFNQAMVRQHLLRQARAAGDTEFEVQIIEEALSNFHRYFFIMPTLAAFELECYRRIEARGTLSAPELIDLTAGLLQQGYGEGVTMDRERSGIMWAQFSTHLYANFYAYQYATGISAAHQLLEQFDHDPVAARTNYVRFLESGGSLDPIDALKEAGVDMLSAAPVEATFRTLARYVDRLEELLAQR